MTIESPRAEADIPKKAIVTINAEDQRTAEAIEQVIRERMPQGTATRFTYYDGPDAHSPVLSHVITLSAVVQE
ncbi:hypothetical protein AAHZ94_15890 [Streptomyces sp. HSW2009]|uniref:hypothetical protein n=1 Tax=Streptomyces sp. HSW2009 TaxID=3142890 RepID=UPI0032EC03FF